MPADDRTLALRLGVAAALSVLLLVPFAVLAAFVAGEWAPLRELDVSVADAAYDWASTRPAMVGVMQVWTTVFSPTGLRIAALVLVIWLFRRGARRVAWWVIVTTVTGGVLNALLKLLFERDRPEFLEPVARATGYSFPSGHAANAALACAVFLLVLLPYGRARLALWAGAVVITVVTGLTRIGLGVHFVSDVAAGWLLGIAVAAVTAMAFHSARRRPPAAVDEPAFS